MGVVEDTHAAVNDIFRKGLEERASNAKAKPGSVRIHYGVVYRKQRDGSWHEKGSPKDVWTPESETVLDEDGEVCDILPGMSQDKKIPNLIPKADLYIDQGFNVLINARHGVGKTESVQQLAQERGFKMAYFSCPTLDPYTDLIGVPQPVYYCPDCDDNYDDRREHRETVPDCSGKLSKRLVMVRPNNLAEAEVVFFDELNRADAQTRNAVLEIVQFRSINGEPLPKLRACWAAVNPDGFGYDVEKIDPVLIDRFDVFVQMTPRVSPQYMAQFMPMPVAKALWEWWKMHNYKVTNNEVDDPNVSYVSPRRMLKLGLIWMASHERKTLEAGFPIEGQYEKNKLFKMLQKADEMVAGGHAVELEEEEPEEEEPDALGSDPSDEFIYTRAELMLRASEYEDFLRNNAHAPTHDAVAAALVPGGMGGEAMVTKLSGVLDALAPATLEGLIQAFPEPKRQDMCKAFGKIHDDDPARAKSYKNLHKVLKTSLSVTLPDNFPATL